MKIDLTKIEGYDQMTPEEKIKALEGAEIEVPKDNSAELARYKELMTKANSEAAEFKKKLREKQTEQEKAEEERAAAQKQMQEELETLRRERALGEHVSQLRGLGISEDDLAAVADAALNGNWKDFYAGLGKARTAFEKSIRADVTKGTPKPAGTGDPSPAPKTKAEIMSIRDASERQKAIAAHPELFGMT